MQALQECAEDEDEGDYFSVFRSNSSARPGGLTEFPTESFSRPVVSVQEVPDDCDTDCELECPPRYYVPVLTSPSR